MHNIRRYVSGYKAIDDFVEKAKLGVKTFSAQETSSLEIEASVSHLRMGNDC